MERLEEIMWSCIDFGGIFRVHILGVAVGHKRKFKVGYELIWFIGEPIQV